MAKVQSPKLVYFDFETTGLSHYTEQIIQIAASCSTYPDFNIYILPTKEINPRASGVTGLYLRKLADGLPHLVREFKKTSRKPQTLETVDMKEGLEKFLSYLAKISAEAGVILIGHNVNTFDISFLFGSLEKIGKLDQLFDLVEGIIDTKIVIKKLHPGLACGYGQGKLFQRFMGSNCTFDAHNAVGDVEGLHKLVKSAGISEEKLIEFGYNDMREMYEKYKERRRKKFGDGNTNKLETKIKKAVAKKTKKKKVKRIGAKKVGRRSSVKEN